MIQRETVDEYQKGTRSFMQSFFDRFGQLINEVLRTLVDGINKLL